MRLFIAEKPSLGRAIAENLGKGVSKDGCIEINNGQDIVTWCFGHILEQYDPGEYDERYKKWVMDDLPIVPEKWKLKVKKEAAKQFKIIKELTKKADYIINAGDPDREGQLLIDEVLLHIGNKKPVKRILLNALDQKSVVQALGDLRDNKDYIGLRDSALARSQADWLVGMNLSRAYTIKSRDAGYDSVVHVGRVQTPTLALVVRREEEIQHFKPTTHYALQVIWQHENGQIPTMWKFKPDMEGLDSENRLLSKDIADGLLSKIQSAANHGDGAQIVVVEQKKKQEGQRLPYSLSTLQVEAGRKYGLTPQQVLDTMQSLYEMKLTTYPRSDCEYLPTNQMGDASVILKNMGNIEEDHLAEFSQRADPQIVSRAWNDAKISAHHALIPTTVPVDMAKLSDEQKKLYLLVARAYLAQFYPIHVYQATKVVISCADEEFAGNGKTILAMGWKEIYQKEKKDSDDNDEEAPVLPAVAEGDVVRYEQGTVKEKITTPPKRFTDATLLQAMKEIHKYVKDKELAASLKECKGIGTEATRAGIIEGLKKARFVTTEKKFLVPTDMGRMVISILPDKITYPDTTALWEADLDRIADGSIPLNSFLTKQVDILNSLLTDAKNVQMQTNKDLPICPNCGKTMRLRKGKLGNFWGCSGYPDCKTTAPDKKGKPDFTVKKEERHTDKCPSCGKKLRQIKGKFGTFWSCEDREGCNATFADHKDKPVIVKCPGCGKGYLRRAESKKKKGAYFWYCSDRCGAAPIWDKSGLPDLP